MNSLVVPLSTREEMDFLSAVSVVSISTLRLRQLVFPSAAAVVYSLGSVFSHFGLCTLGDGGGLDWNGDR